MNWDGKMNKINLTKDVIEIKQYQNKFINNWETINEQFAEDIKKHISDADYKILKYWLKGINNKVGIEINYFSSNNKTKSEKNYCFHYENKHLYVTENGKED